MKKHKNVVLIGFMGVGKGSVARELGKEMHMFTVDGDDLIESYENKKINKIFHDNGEAEFRKIEKTLAKFLEHSVSNAIISTGGGFYKVKNLKKIGKIIYLKSSFDNIIERIKSSPNSKKKLEKRPLLANLDKAKALHSSREKEYEKKADFIVDVEGKTAEQLAKEIKKILKKAKI